MEVARPSGGLERMGAFFRGQAFAPHRHDTYALGVTTWGVQVFDYRGATRRSLTGQVFVLHPDERHDGREGDERGFGYRIAYLDPSLVRDATEGRTLPFLRDPVSEDEGLRAAVSAIVSNLDESLAELASTGHLVALADALVRLAQGASSLQQAFDERGVRLVRDILLTTLDAKMSIGTLETISGLTRWQLARQFRRAYGVSPYRFHLLRRLDRARELLRSGCPLVNVAQSVGFSDRAHLTRQFRQAYGFPPGKWLAVCA